MTVISNVSVISLFLNELSSNLTHDARIKIAQKLIFFVICHKKNIQTPILLILQPNTCLNSGYHGNSLGPWWSKNIPNDVW